MQKQFVTYEISLKLKELGFDEKCEAIYNPTFLLDGCWNTTNSYINIFNKDTPDIVCAAPLWQQAIDWFVLKHKYQAILSYGDHSGKWAFQLNAVNGGRKAPFRSDYAYDYLGAREQAILKAIELISK